ncbi:MAG: transposase [Chloroflexi bacterium]|nr:transposase [Chloroflexota bacterium]MBI5704360.1 transposase [Chloroflexota bacterium]
MEDDKRKTELIPSYYTRKLPHWHPEGAMFFITFRLANSLPAHILQALEAEHEREKQIVRAKYSGAQQYRELYKLDKKYFGRFDSWLDRCVEESPRWLANERVAQIVAEEIHRLDGERYMLIAYCLMSNHVHLVIDTAERSFQPTHAGVTANYPLADTLKLLKGRTARFCNQALGRSDSFWQAESYDHVIRNQKEYENIVWYTLNNPVKAGLVEKWEDWKYTYFVGRN